MKNPPEPKEPTTLPEQPEGVKTEPVKPFETVTHDPCPGCGGVA